MQHKWGGLRPSLYAADSMIALKKDIAVSVTDDLAALNAAMQAFGPVYKTARAKKVAASKEADVTTLLNNLTVPVFTNTINQNMQTHINKKAPVHVTASQMNMRVYAASDALDANYVSALNTPVSRYGDLSRIPIGVAGNYEGASTDTTWRNCPGLYEDDGTFSYLRNGTDGAVFSVYHAYISQPLTTSTTVPTNPPVRTTNKYAPSFLTSNAVMAKQIYRSDENCLIGSAQNIGTPGAVAYYWVALTNGTMDETKHIGCFIAAAAWNAGPGACGQNVEAVWDPSTQKVYIIANQNLATGTFGVWSIPLATIQQGQIVTTLTSVANWNTTSYHKSYSATGIQLWDSVTSTTDSVNTVVYVTGTNPGNVSAYPFWASGAMTYTAPDGTGNFRTRIVGDFYALNNVTGAWLRQAVCLSFTWNPATLVAQVDTMATMPIVLTVAANGNVSAAGTGLASTLAQVVSGGAGNALSSQAYQPALGYWTNVSQSNLSDSTNYVGVSKMLNGSMSKFAALHYQQLMSQVNSQVPFKSAFGSAIGGQLIQMVPITPTAYVSYAAGRNNAGVSTTGLVYGTLGADGYSYGSLANGTLTGFAPTNVRKFIAADMGLSETDFSCIISEVDSTTTTATATYYVEGIHLSGWTTVDSNLNVSGSASVSSTVLQSIKTSLFAAIGNPTGVLASNLSLIQPQRFTAVGTIAVLMYVDSGGTTRIVFFSITTTGTGGNITGMSGIISQTLIQAGTTLSSGLLYDTSYRALISGGITVYKGTDGYFIGGCTKYSTQGAGDNINCYFRFALPISTGKIDWSTLVTTWAGIEGGMNGYAAYPSSGFGANQQVASTSDNFTKMIFKPYAKAMADYNAWSSSFGGLHMWFGQTMASSWTLYITTAVPCFLAGNYGNIPPANIDLTTIQSNPANTTFNVYLVASAIKTASNSPTLSYKVRAQISNDPQPADWEADTMTQMFIGQVGTGATGITSIGISKVSRLGLYRPSETSQAWAMSMTTGLPMSSPHLNWS